MKCPRCGEESRTLETRETPDMTVRRRRECPSGHGFTTVEIHRTAALKAETRIKTQSAAASAARRLALYHRDSLIASELHKGWRKLAERFGLTKAAIYLAAQRGRKNGPPLS